MIRKRRERPQTYRKVFYIVAEGAVTEISYMKHVVEFSSRGYRVKTIDGKVTQSGMKHIISRAKKAENASKKGDEIWVLVDRDEEAHTLKQFEELGQWEKESPDSHYVAISNPRFEYWLLLHFEKSPSAHSALKDGYLDRHLPDYSEKKDLSNYETSITRERIEQAVELATKSKAQPTCQNPNVVGTGVGELVRKLIS